ncbi:hypothetical protein [Mycoplasma miroungirhinis]|uniref:Uncharacterized protein n=1 Tax=Mycoplasma miroungirhinis TaxID=754516 RepID=A0A6M4JFU4_9MOLU|nr:hypothetical protein [Mycoplasma miroungirhinis]QJR43892.1 hypothetical protein HLA92_00225 [Mycoplasma miroungirhinis]
MINFENTQQATTNATTSNTNNTIILLFAFILIVSLYIAVKFSIHFKKSLEYTKKAIGYKLKKPFVYGLKFSTPSLINLFIFEILLVVIMIWTAINFASDIKNFYKNLEQTNSDNQTTQLFFDYASPRSLFNYFTISLAWIYAPLVFLYNFIIFKKSFKDEQYHDKNFAFKLKEDLLEEYKENQMFKEIKIDIEDMKTKNPLGAKVLAKKTYEFNNFDQLDFAKAYKFALEMEFIKNYYEFYVKNFTFFGKYFEDKKILNFQIDYQNDYSSTMDKQIQWMNDVDRSFKNNKDNVPLELYNYKNINITLMKNQRKNSSLTTNTNDINYLGADPSIHLSYSLDGNVQPKLDILDILKVISENTWKKLILKI